MKTKRFHGIHTHLTAWVAALAILLSALPAEAQEDYRFDIGGGIGMTGYLGDANTANLYKNPSWDIEVLLRYIANPRWAFKTNFYAGGLKGNSERFPRRGDIQVHHQFL